MIQTSAAVVDVGGASIQITIFRDGKLITTQHIETGIMRIHNLLGDRGLSQAKYEMQIEEYMNKKLEAFRAMYMSEDVDYVILISDYAMELMKRMDETGNKERQVKGEKFVKYIEKLQMKTLEEITAELKLSNDREPLIIPSSLRRSGCRERIFRMVSHMIMRSGISYYRLRMILMRM